MPARSPLHRIAGAALTAVALWGLSGCADAIALATDGGPDADDGGAEVLLPMPVDVGGGPDTRPSTSDGGAGADGALDGSADAEVDFGPCITPAEEICNRRDDDCDGATDEGAVCCRENAEICNGVDDDCDGSADEGAVCCGMNPEICNDIDDDCDGTADEGIECCEMGAEICDGRDNDCDGSTDEGEVCCDPVPEICDAQDNDCDGAVDEEGACCADEVCNGADDDCDGVADEGRICGVFVQENCRLFWAWADSRRGPPGVSNTWGPCPGIDRQDAGNIRCTATRYDGNFARMTFQGDVNDDDQFGLALLCRPGPDAELAAWVQSQCALFMGYADSNRAPNGGPVFAGCPNALETIGGNLRCTSTGYDGRFRPLMTQGDVGGDDDFSFAWICRDDPARPGLAAAMQGQVEVFAGWADERRGPADGSPVWSTCPGARSQQGGEVRCVGTAGDGQFHKLNLIGDVNGDDQAGIALRAKQ